MILVGPTVCIAIENGSHKRVELSHARDVYAVAA